MADHGCGLKYAHVHQAIDRVNDCVELCSYIIFGNTWVQLMEREREEEFVLKVSEKTVWEGKKKSSRQANNKLINKQNW